MEELHGEKEKSTTPRSVSTSTRRTSTASTGKMWPVVPTGFPYLGEEPEEEVTTSASELEVEEVEEVTLTPREERARRRNQKLSISQRTCWEGVLLPASPPPPGTRPTTGRLPPWWPLPWGSWPPSVLFGGFLPGPRPFYPRSPALWRGPSPCWPPCCPP